MLPSKKTQHPYTPIFHYKNYQEGKIYTPCDNNKIFFINQYNNMKLLQCHKNKYQKYYKSSFYATIQLEINF